MTAVVDATVEVSLPAGAVDVSVSHRTPDDAWARVLIAHGAGAGKDHPFMTGLADGLADVGIATTLFNFPYVEASRRMPGPAAHAIAAWGAIRAAAPTDLPVWLAGKSYGGRMASMAVADGLPTEGLVYLGYPLHAPGKPEAPRVEHLPRIAAPQLFLSGTKDPFVDPHEQLEAAVASCPDAEIHWIQGGGHSFEVAGNKRKADVIGAELAPIIVGFIRR